MSSDGLLSRLRKGRVVQVVTVYLAACWIVLQVVATLKELIGLPDWVGPTTVVLLLLGFVIVAATIWVQSNPVTDARENSGEVPRDWDVAFTDLLRSLRAGRMPHLNWARAATGGVVAISLLVGVAGVYVLAQDGGRAFRTASVAAAEAGVGVAVLPFQASGAGVDSGLGEGLMDLIATNIDAITGLRAISPRSVVARSGDAQPSDRRLLELARELRATYIVIGRVTGVGDQLRVTADVRETRGGRRVGTPVHADGSVNELLQLADRLSVQVASLVLEGEPEFAPGFRPSLSLTASPAALRAFLEGESEFRRLEFARAMDAYRRAVQEDTTFALAWARVGTLAGWVDPGTSEIGAALQRALRDRNRLPERDRLVIEGQLAGAGPDVRGLEPLRAAVRRYPDDALLWNALGEYYTHHGQYFLFTQRDAYDAFLHAVRLEPEFVPHYIHAIELSVMLDDTATSRALVAAPGIRLDTDDARGLLISHELAFSSGDRWYSARAALDTIWSTGTSIEIPLTLPRLLELKEHYTQLRRERQPSRRTARILLTTFAARGRLAAAVAQLEDPLLSAHERSLHAFLLYSLGASAPVAGWNSYFGLAHVDPTLSMFVMLSAAYAADRLQWAEYARAVGLMQEMEQLRAERHDTLALNNIQKRRLAAEGYGAWKRGELEEARQLFDRLQPMAGDGISGMARWWAGEVALAQGRDLDALRYYESLRMWDSDMNEFPLRHLRIAQIHERNGRRAQARAALEEFLLIWKDADASHPALEEAKVRLARVQS